jgi:hypothetical protein
MRNVRVIWTVRDIKIKEHDGQGERAFKDATRRKEEPEEKQKNSAKFK